MSFILYRGSYAEFVHGYRWTLHWCVFFFFQNPIEYCQLEASKNNYELAKNSIVFDWISAHLSGKKSNP